MVFAKIKNAFGAGSILHIYAFSAGSVLHIGAYYADKNWD
jgi:hypothetical protein